MTVEIKAADIKKLRDLTGISMGKCKDALTEANGNIDLAVENLRKAGLAQAAKKSMRETKEGMIATASANGAVAFIEVKAETDFVANNDRFREFANNIAEQAAATKASSVEALMAQKFAKEPAMTIEEYRGTLIQTIGENIQIGRMTVIALTGNSSLGIYSHSGGKLVSAVELEGAAGEEDFAREIAMHVAAARPQFCKQTDVPADVLEKEREIAKAQVQGKPANIVDKIVDGKIKAFFADTCLTDQAYIKDDKHSVNEVVAARGKEKGKSLQIKRFVCWQVGVE
jgi:elongation factor Ts